MNWRVSCTRRGGVRFTLRGQSNFNLVMISNVGGSGDIKAAWVRDSRARSWVPLHRNWGANWQSSFDLRNQKLSFKLTLVDGKTLEFFNVVPSTWRFGQTFSSRSQFSWNQGDSFLLLHVLNWHFSMVQEHEDAFFSFLSKTSFGGTTYYISWIKIYV